jgi:hypothetical protein
LKKILLGIALVILIFPASAYAQAPNPWSEVFDDQGNLRTDLVDLGVTTEHPDWMSMDLPFGQSIDLMANYHRYQTSNGDVVILPSASTLFFMAMNPEESGLSNAIGRVENGVGSLITFLGSITGNNLDWNRVVNDHPEFKTPDQYWNAVINGKVNAWTYFSGWGFINTLFLMSENDLAMRNAYLMYLQGAKNCAIIPGGCSGIVNPPPPQDRCPDPTVSVPAPSLGINKSAPAHPLVIGQDPQNKRGVDIQVNVTIPPVIFTWHEPIYENRDVCRGPRAGESPNCKTSSEASSDDGVKDSERVFKECREHVEHLPDAAASIQATASLDAASQSWITQQLGQTHYGAFIHQTTYSLIPGLGTWSDNCGGDGTCIARGQALKVPFSDPGTYNLRMQVLTKGTSFQGIPITQPRKLTSDGKMQVYLTLPALVP